MKIINQLKQSENPTIQYKTRLLRGEDPKSPQMKKLREKIAGSDNAKRLLGHRQADGTIAAGPYRKWQGPHWTLHSLDMIKYPPGDKSLIPLRDQVYDWLLDPAHLKFPQSLIIPGQKDRIRRCASQEGNAVLYSMKLGFADDRTEVLVDRLIDFQWPDGGWNCDRRPEARKSSFQETLIPLQALARYGRTYQHERAVKAAERAAEYLLAHRLLFRLSDGKIIRPAWGGDITKIHYPIQFYDVLYVLMVMAEIGRLDDERCRPALELLASKQLPDGGFPVEIKNYSKSDTIKSRGSFADWGPTGKKQSNPFVAIDALTVLTKAGFTNLNKRT